MKNMVIVQYCAEYSGYITTSPPAKSSNKNFAP